MPIVVVISEAIGPVCPMSIANASGTNVGRGASGAEWTGLTSTVDGEAALPSPAHGAVGTSAQVLSDVVPQNDIRAPQELVSRRIIAPRSGWGGGFPAGRAPRPGRRAIGPH